MKNKIDKGSPLSDIPESYQRYLDEIYTISRKKKGGWINNKEISERLNVKPASVSGMLKNLKEKGLINWAQRKSIRLTTRGKNIAKKLNETHLLLKIFFGKVLKIKDEIVVEKISCEIEHHIDENVKESLKKFLTNYLD